MRLPRHLPLALAVTAACLGACVGPTFHRPAPPAAQGFVSPPLPAATASAATPGGAAQQFLAARDVPADWWTLFESAELNALVNEALRANPGVHAAQAALRVARENTAAQRGSYFPQVQASFAANRQRDAVGVLSPNLASGAAIYNLYTPQVGVTFVPDLLGGNRRAVESLAALEEASRDELDATYLTLTGNVVTAAVQEAGLRAQVDATERVIGLERDALAVLRRSLELGSVADSDVYTQEAALAQLESTLPPLQRQLRQNHDLLAVLLGRLPADLPPVKLSLDELHLPAELPLGVPSQLVERRPDVRAAEAQLHAATAQVGVSVASMLPQLTITGGFGSTAAATGQLFRAGTGFWDIGASLSETLFAGGSLLHRKRAADAALDQAGATYQATVLTAFQNVADALHALQVDADAVAAAARAEAATGRSLDVTRQQQALGSVGFLAVVLAEQGYQQAVATLAQARTSRYLDTAALFQALGGSVSAPATR